LGQSIRGLSVSNVTTVMMPVVEAPSDPNRVIAQEPKAGELWESLK
ncbi:MAG TPA: LytR family transcriptional regulator, partial [Streptomyces sp.]